MKHLLPLLFAALGYCGILQAQGPCQLSLHCPEENVHLYLDLYEESINVPGMDMFGPMNGYLGGNIYGVWSVTSFKIQDDKVATLRLSNDLGSETQKATLTWQSDSLYVLRFDGQNVVKRAVGKKLVKIPSEFKMRTDAR